MPPQQTQSVTSNPGTTTTNYSSGGSSGTGSLSSAPASNYNFTPVNSSPPTLTASNNAPSVPIQPIQPAPATLGMQLGNTIGASADQFQQNLDQNAQAALQNYQSPLSAYIQALGSSKGLAGFQSDIYQNTGVNDAQANLRDLNNQILAEKNATNQTIQNLKTTNPNGLYGGAQDQAIQTVQDQSNARLANLAVRQAVAQGDYTQAREIADRSVQAQYEQQQNYLGALQAMASSAKDLFTTAQKNAFDAALATRQSQLDTQKQQSADLYKYYITYGQWPAGMSGGPGSTFTSGSTGAPSTTGGSGGVQGAISALVGNESGGNYQAMSPQLPNGQQSYGKYQVLDSNIGPWTQQYYGQTLTPQQFLANPQAQDAVAQGRIGELWNKYGNINDVASVWFTGRPYAQAVADGAKDPATGMTVQQYVQKAANSFNGFGASAPPGGSNSTDFKGTVPVTDAGAMASTNPNDLLGYQLATGTVAPSQALTARNISGNSPEGRMLLQRANAISMAKYNTPFNMADAEAAYKVRNSPNYQTFIESAPNAVRAIGEVMNNLKTLQDAGYLTGITNLNSLQLKGLASGAEFWAPANVKQAAANVLSTLSQSQDDIGKLLGTGQGSDAKIALAGAIFGQNGGLNTTGAVAQNVSKNITAKLGDMFTAAGLSPDSPSAKALMARLQPSLDAINSTTSAANDNTHVYNGVTYVKQGNQWVAQK